MADIYRIQDSVIKAFNTIQNISKRNLEWKEKKKTAGRKENNFKKEGNKTSINFQRNRIKVH